MIRFFRKANIKQTLKEYGAISVGAAIVAVGLNVFLIPNRLAAGGVSGLSTVLYYQLNLPVGVMMAIFNIGLFAIGARVLGWRYGKKTLYGAFSLALLVDVLAPVVPPVANDAFLGTLYGGILSGIGMGLVFKNGGSTGGTDIVAQILRKYSNLGLGQLFLIADGFVMLAAASVFGIKLALYGMVAVIIMGRIIDLMQEGSSLDKAAFIISDAPSNITTALNDFGGDIKIAVSQGGDSNSPRGVIFCIVPRRDLGKLKRAVNSADPSALVVAIEAREVPVEEWGELPAA